MTKRELIEPNPGDKRYVRRDDKGQFTEQVGCPFVLFDACLALDLAWRQPEATMAAARA